MAYFARDIEREFISINVRLQFGGKNDANDGIALIANNFGLVSPRDAIQTPTAIRIAEVGTGKRSRRVRVIPAVQETRRAAEEAG